MVRTAEGLSRAQVAVDEIAEELSRSSGTGQHLWEARNIALAAQAIIAAASFRQESRGAHFRADFPTTDPLLDGRHSLLAGCPSMTGRSAYSMKPLRLSLRRALAEAALPVRPPAWTIAINECLASWNIAAPSARDISPIHFSRPLCSSGVWRACGRCWPSSSIPTGSSASSMWREAKARDQRQPSLRTSSRTPAGAPG